MASNEASDRHQVLKDPLFWTRLAYASSGLLRESPDKSQRRFWVDDFMPESATDTKQGVNIEGMAWVVEGSQTMLPYRFLVSIPQRMLGYRRDNFLIERFELNEEHHTLRVEIGQQRPIP